MRTLFLLTALFAAAPLLAQPVDTQVRVRVASQDAKLLHDGVGGARVTIRDLATGDTLAAGVQTGSSGSTDRIMREGRARRDTLYNTEGAAHFLATLALDRPTRVEIAAEGPLGIPDQAQRAATTLWLTPGHDILGEGVVLTLYGFVVELLDPTPETVSGDALPVRARVRMMCGCPTEPGGLWDADGYAITARLVRDGEILTEAPLTFTGTTSEYEGSLDLAAIDAGPARLEVLAADGDHANVGLSHRAVTLE